MRKRTDRTRLDRLREFCLRRYWPFEHRYLPNYRETQSVYSEALDELVRDDSVWLDVGCGHQILPPWHRRVEQRLVERSGLVIGMDRELQALRRHGTIRLRVQADATTFPFADGSFSLVTANMVVEHLTEPEVQFGEIFRVLQKGGHFVFHTPNRLSGFVTCARLVPGILKRPLIRLLDGRPSSDVFPAFYRANSRRDIRALASRIGFELVTMRMLAGAGTPLLALLPPLLVAELYWARVLHTEKFAGVRSNIICILRRPT